MTRINNQSETDKKIPDWYNMQAKNNCLREYLITEKANINPNMFSDSLLLIVLSTVCEVGYAGTGYI